MSLPISACFIPLWVILVLQHLICTKAAPVVPFSVPYDPAAVSDLAGKLSKIRYPHEVDGGGEDWYPGAPVEVVQRLVEHWQNNFDWSAQVAKLNEMPQFTMQLGEHNVHFVHQRSSNQNATALLLIHGWPGSFWECSKILPLLTEPQLHGGRAEDAFHVVCPSIPGFGYSSKPTRPGFDQMECAKVFATLMHELNYVEYYLQGGDWGSVVASLQAVLPPGPARGKVLGLHLNMVPAPPPVMKGPVAVANLMLSVVLPSWYYSPQEWKDIKETPLRSLLQTGYFHQQSTKPSTTAYGLSDSPVGLMAWIVEKFYEWSDCHGDVFSRFTEDELLTNVMIYWMTNSAGPFCSLITHPLILTRNH